jgi:hypothetical protein
MAILKRTLPAVLAIAVGAVVLASLLLPVPQLAAAGRYLIDTAIVIAAFALFLGLINVVRVHVRHIRQRTATWPYSVLLLVVLATVLAIGLVYSPLRGEGGASAPAVRWIFTYVLAPIEATLGALLAFFILIAAYRLLRLRNVESAVLLVVALLVLIGQASTGLFPALSDLRNWILDVPVVAGVRGILLGVALGTNLTGIRLLLGVERPYGD